MGSAVSNQPRVGYLYSYFPLEILHAFGRLPVRILPGVSNPADSEPYLHKNFCALAKTTLARFLDGGAAGYEGVILSDLCDAQRRLHDVWRIFSSVPVLTFLDMPRRTDSLGVEYYASALERAVVDLEKRFGQPLLAGVLAASVQVYNRQRTLWNELTCAWTSGRITTDRYSELRDLRWTSAPEIANGVLEQALAESATVPPAPRRGPRLLVMGSLNVPRYLTDAIEEGGGAWIVAEDSACSPCRVSKMDVSGIETDIPIPETRAGLLRALAVAYIDTSAPRQRDLSRRLDFLGKLVRTRQVQGVICSYYKFCDLYLAEFPIVKKYLEAQNVRVLLLEDEGEANLSGQARTRVQAFLEILADTLREDGIQ